LRSSIAITSSRLPASSESFRHSFVRLNPRGALRSIAIAQHPCAFGHEPVAHRQDVVDLIADVVDATVGVALQELCDR
jgi:hypothetical protein